MVPVRPGAANRTNAQDPGAQALRFQPAVFRTGGGDDSGAGKGVVDRGKGMQAGGREIGNAEVVVMDGQFDLGERT
jgi:hypothetical protein